MNTTSAIDPHDPATTLPSIAPKLTPFFSGNFHLTPCIGADGKPVKKRWGRFWKVPLAEFTNGRPPLTFHDSDGAAYQPDNHFVSDGGSVPPLLWGVPFLSLDPQAYPRSYPLHDSAFRYGGLYVREYGTRQRFRFQLLERRFCDDLLKRMVRADGAGRGGAWAIRFGVWLGSRWCWDTEEQRANREADGVNI